MRKLLARNVRLLAQLAGGVVAGDKRNSALQISRQVNDNFATLESQMDTVRFEFEFRRRREGDLVECEWIRRAQPSLRAIYVLELSLLSHRGRRESGSALSPVEDGDLNRFLQAYSAGLVHVAEWIAREVDMPLRIADDSIRLLQQTFESHSSPNARVLADISRDMVSSLSLLRNEC